MPLVKEICNIILTSVTYFNIGGKMKKIITSLSIMLMGQVAFADVLPVALRLEGIGAVAGAAYKKGSKEEKKQLIAGAAAGDFIAAGGIYTEYRSPRFELSYAVGVIRDLESETTYLRGLQNDEGRTYTQNLNILGGAIGSRYWIKKDKLRFNSSLTVSSVELKSFEDSKGEISLPGAKLFDVTTVNTKAGLEYMSFNNTKSKGYKVGADLAVLLGRKGQSDHLVTGLNFKGLYPIHESVRLSVSGNYSHASIITERYKTKEKIKKAFNVNCSSISDAEDKKRCETLESDLVDFVFDHNTKGSTNPFGGSNSPRSFRELRFKSAFKAAASAEIGWDIVKAFNITKLKGKRIEFVIFHDIAHGSDSRSSLFDSSVYSTGGGVNFGVEELDIKLQAASGSYDSSAWFLSVGSRI